jgi:methylsterol monooxygenase
MGVIVMGSHMYTMWAWTVFRIAETVDAHCGYDFPISFHTSRRHDFHHSKNIGCYGSFTPWWDQLCGTDKKFLEHEAKRKKAEQSKKSE